MCLLLNLTPFSGITIPVLMSNLFFTYSKVCLKINLINCDAHLAGMIFQTRSKIIN
ncbi:MAG: DUF6783 domain-containing protein [Blautia wexlerae]